MAPTTRSCGILDFIMTSQLNTRYPKRPNSASTSFKPIYESRTLGDQKIQLLKAPGVDSEVMWKQQCFESVYNRLRTKLSDACNADSIISVFNTHFPISTLSAEDQARSAVADFRLAFKDVSFLKPTSFVNRFGDDVTGKMYEKPRPANVCHLGVTAEIDMSVISKAFSSNMMFITDYFLPLPQSSGPSKTSPLRAIKPTTDGTTPTLGTAEVLDTNVFSPPSKKDPSIDLTKQILNVEAGMVTPVASGRRLHPGSDIEDNVSETDVHQDELADANSVNVDLTPGNIETQDDPNAIPPQEDLNLFTLLSKSPKSTSLIMENQPNKSGSTRTTWTYEGPIGILDDQSTFQDQIPTYDAFYELSLNSNGQRNVLVKKVLEKRLKTIENIVQLRVFCYEFKKSYVGNNDNSAAQITATIQNCASKLRNIKMISRDYVSNQFITISPDAVYSKMLEMVQLLPNDALNWGFCLPWLYFEALSYNLQDDLRDSGYIPPTSN